MSKKAKYDFWKDAVIAMLAIVYLD